MIDCPSIINMNRLIDIDCYRLPSIIDFINCSGPDRMKILNYDVEDKQSNYKEKVPFMPDRCFRMVVCRPSGSVKLIFFWI